MNEIEFTLTKTKTYKVKPFGRFVLKFQVTAREAQKLGVISSGELTFNYESGMPIVGDTDKAVVKFMIKNKTDVLVDESTNFYTRVGRGFTQINHIKLQRYNTFLRENGGVDDLEMWNAWKEKNKEI